MSKQLLNVKDKRIADTIAALAIRFAAEAAKHLPAAECDLRLQLAAALLKSTMLPAISQKFFENDDGSLVAKIFSDGMPIPPVDDDGWDLV